MAKPRTPVGRADAHDPVQAALDELRRLTEAMDPDFSFFAGQMDLLRLDSATVAHALARAGAVEDARRVLPRVKKVAHRAVLRAITIAQAEVGAADAARQTALELPAVGPCSARSTLVEIADALARRGDFDEAVQTAEELQDANQSARTLANIAQLQAEFEVGNFANARAVPEPHSNHSWVGMAKLFSEAGSRGEAATATWALTLRRAIERARLDPKAAAKSQTLETLVHNLAWGGDAEGAVLAARVASGTAGQEKALVTVVAGLAGRHDYAAAEQVAATIKGKAARAEAQAYFAAARARGGGPIGEPFPDEPWNEVLADAEHLDHPDERLSRIVRHVAFHPLPEDARQAFRATLLRVRAALTDGAAAIRLARLSPAALERCDYTGQVKGRRKRVGAESDVEATRAARLCRIAGAQGTAGDLAAGAETAGRIEDGDFRACALALASSGYFEFQERLRHCKMPQR